MYGRVLKYRMCFSDSLIESKKICSPEDIGKVLDGCFIVGDYDGVAEFPRHEVSVHLLCVDFFESDEVIDIKSIKKIREYTTFEGIKVYVYDSTHFNIKDII